MFIVAVVQLDPTGRISGIGVTPEPAGGEGLPTYFYFAIALFGAAMTPYEVFFFSSGAVEEKWTRKDLGSTAPTCSSASRSAGSSRCIMAVAAIVFLPLGVSVDHLHRSRSRRRFALGKLGLASVILGFFAAPSAPRSRPRFVRLYVSQYFGWQWGKLVRPARRPGSTSSSSSSIFVGVLVGVTAIDPIKVTEYSIVLSAAALPLTYLPILVVANDRTTWANVNGRPEHGRELLHGALSPSSRSRPSPS